MDVGIGIIWAVDHKDGKVSKLRVQGLFEQAPRLLSRTEVIAQIKRGTQFHTLYKPHGSDHLSLGPLVRLFTVNGKDYLRTGPDDIEEDNLGELPSV
jgi:hypothetical protein